MSGKLESALVIELVDAIKWGAALEPTAADGSLTVVDPSKPLDITKYSRRDRELAYRDLINATAVLKVALHTESVWNSAVTRPKLQGITVDDLPPTTGDLGATDSTVVHVKNSSIPSDAIVADKDLAGRDALIYEVLAKACEVFSEPPITSPGSGAVPQSAWSLAEGVDYGVQPSPSLPLNKNAFYLSDVTLAQRDNFVAAYAAKIADILRNPFAFANRLYVRIDGVDARDAEVYALIRRYYVAGESYDVGDEVYYGTKWYQAVNPTTDPPTNTTDWVETNEPRLREWTAEPALPFRNRIIYDTVAKTLQWFRETTDTTHIPQLYAMSIPGLFMGQTINTLAAVPERKDCQYWRQKAARIDYNGTISELASVYQDTTQIPGGVHLTDTIALTTPNEIDIPLGVPVYVGHKYRLSALVRPTNQIEFYGSRNLLGLTSSDGNAATFSGIYEPTSTSPGQPVTYQANLPAGTWYLSIEYTNASGVADGFGVQIMLDDTSVADDTSPLLFQDADGNALENGTPVTSQEWQIAPDGTDNVLKFTWTYGSGQFQINKIILRTNDRSDAEYFIKAEIHDQAGSAAAVTDLYFGSAPTVESTGRKNIYEVLNWDFTCILDDPDPVAKLTWMSSSDLPIEIRQISLSELKPSFATPGVTGFDAFKWECLRRAERSIQTAFLDEVRTTTGTMADFTTDGTIWNKNSTDNWMSLVEVREPRLRTIPNVTSIRDGFQYQVAGGYVVYNGGTYSQGEFFNGTTQSSFLGYGTDASVDQYGAFRLSSPIDLGHPGIMPLGLWFDESISEIRMSNEPSDQVPTLASIQPWMIEAGVYVAEDDFKSADTAASAPDTVTVTVSADPSEGGTVLGAGRYGIFESVLLIATPSPSGSSTSYIDWGVDIAIVLDESGSMASARAQLQAIFSQVETLLTAAGVGTGALPNKYALVGFGGTYLGHGSHGHVDVAFGSFSTLNSFLGSMSSSIFVGGDEDGYAGISYALGGLSWRASPNVIKFVVLVTDEDRNFHYYTTGGANQSDQFTALKGDLNTVGAKLISLTQTQLFDNTAATVLGYKYGGKTYKADGAGGFTNGTGGYSGVGYQVGGVGGDTGTFPTGSKEEYVYLAQDPGIQGSSWDFGQTRVGGTTATSFQKAVIAAVVEDITFQITTTWGWAFVGWYDEGGNLLSTSTTYAFTATANQNIIGRFVRT